MAGVVSMLPKVATYDELKQKFRWGVPELFNIGVDACDKWAEAEPARLALTKRLPSRTDLMAGTSSLPASDLTT